MWRPTRGSRQDTHDTPPCLPWYSRANYGREAVGGSTTMRNTDKRVYRTHVTLNTLAKVRLSRSRSDVTHMVVQQEVRA